MATTTFMKKLAANEKGTRDLAVSNLRIYLRSRNEFSEEELLKLWKGLFYCMWMSDKPRNQQQLARDLSELIDVVNKPAVVSFIDAFWKTMAREWTGIDRLRMDKYLYLVRQVLYVSLRYLAKNGYQDTQALEDVVTAMVDTPLNARDAKVPNGLRYHMLDIYIDELEKANDETEADLPAKELLAPIMELSSQCPTKSIRRQAQEVLADVRVRNWLGLAREEEEEEEGEGPLDDDDRKDQASRAENGSGDWGGFED